MPRLCLGDKVKEKDGVAALADYPGEVRFDAPMSAYTTLAVGGPAAAMVFPRTVEEVAWLMRRRLDFFVLGAGSNLVVRDGGIAGVVINTRYLDAVEATQADTLTAQCGTLYPRLAVHAQRHGLSGLEFAAGIPGTVGGAVVMNAGIPEQETASMLKEVTLVEEDGRIVSYKREALHFEYRRGTLPRGVVVSACFGLRPAPCEEIKTRMAQLLARRRETQPLSHPNVGSVFKNPPGDFAGRLIEKAGLKGYRMGDAQISERHANFIVNHGQASARDVLDLIHMMGRRVETECGVRLETEVKVVGKDLP